MDLKESSKKIIKNLFGEKPSHYWRYFFDRKEMRKALKKREKNIQLQHPSKIAIIFIGSNKYIKFFPKYYLTIKHYFLPKTKKDFFVFTDKINYSFLKNKKDVMIIKIKHEDWPFSTMRRFEYINGASKKLKKYSHIIFIDADMYVNQPINEQEFFSHKKSLFGVKHPNFVKLRGLFEFNPISKAAVSENDDLSTYWQGCFWGGKTKEVLNLSKELEKRTNADFKKDFIAAWHDESHLNKYFIERKKEVYTYNPSYAYPKKRPIPKPFKKKIVHMTGQDPNKLRYIKFKKVRNINEK